MRLSAAKIYGSKLTMKHEKRSQNGSFFQLLVIAIITIRRTACIALVMTDGYWCFYIHKTAFLQFKHLCE